MYVHMNNQKILCKKSLTTGQIIIAKNSNPLVSNSNPNVDSQNNNIVSDEIIFVEDSSIPTNQKGHTNKVFVKEKVKDNYDKDFYICDERLISAISNKPNIYNCHIKPNRDEVAAAWSNVIAYLQKQGKNYYIFF